MTKDVFLCANKSKLTCGDKRECEQFFRRGSIPLQYKIHRIRGIQFILINIAKSKWHFNVSPLKPYWCYPIFYHEIVNFIISNQNPIKLWQQNKHCIFRWQKIQNSRQFARSISAAGGIFTSLSHKRCQESVKNIKKIWKNQTISTKKNFVRCLLAQSGGHLSIPVTWKDTKKISKKYQEK